jgi:ABC-type phosphate transport system auxiliary subunit
LTNAGLDILAALRKNGVEITSDNIDDHIAKREAEVDALNAKVNE